MLPSSYERDIERRVTFGLKTSITRAGAVLERAGMEMVRDGPAQREWLEKNIGDLHTEYSRTYPGLRKDKIILGSFHFLVELAIGFSLTLS